MRTVSFRNIPSVAGIKVDVVEKKYNAVYIGDFPLKLKGGGWSESPAAFFWQETPPVAGYSNYFAAYVRGDAVYITSGESITEGTISAIDCGGDNIVHSRYRHDYRPTSIGSAIDGGRDYTRIIGTEDGAMPRVVKLKVNGPLFEVIDEPLMEPSAPVDLEVEINQAMMGLQ